MRYTKIYFGISAAIIAVGIFALFKWGLNLGLDFKGGTVAEYELENEVGNDEISANLIKSGFESVKVERTDGRKYYFQLEPLDENRKEELKNSLKEVGGENINELRYETVGPSIGPELIKKTVYAAIIASVAILLWVAYQFKSIMFGASAILAMFHDTFILIGSFALLGHFFGAETDFLFVTALLTTLSFSVHDTIVVYDRIRESQRKSQDDLYHLANKAITETMVRSLNNSFTILFMLSALILLGGDTVRWFAIALFIGTVSGTYSSPFVAVPLLVTWDRLRHKRSYR